MVGGREEGRDGDKRGRRGGMETNEGGRDEGDKQGGGEKRRQHLPLCPHQKLLIVLLLEEFMILMVLVLRLLGKLQGGNALIHFFQAPEDNGTRL